jgi:3-hydroxyisobutyrate dehydrogenase-like beta-hydroxyacid dehydrogenase
MQKHICFLSGVVVFLNGREQCQKYFRHSLEPSDFRARTFICMSTLLQEDVLEFHRIVTSNGGQFIESPIVGTRQLAKSLKVQVRA